MTRLPLTWSASGTRMNRSKMRILILSQFFPPEIGATQTRVHAFAAGLAELATRSRSSARSPTTPRASSSAGYRRAP